MLYLFDLHKHNIHTVAYLDRFKRFTTNLSKTFPAVVPALSLITPIHLLVSEVYFNVFVTDYIYDVTKLTLLTEYKTSMTSLHL